MILGVAHDDRTLQGAWWEPSLEIAGTFTASRTATTPAFLDVNGAWRIRFLGDREAVCNADLSQDRGQLQVELTCPAFGNVALTGSVHLLTGKLFLASDVPGRGLSLDGVISPEDGTGTGTWLLPPVEPARDPFDDPSFRGCFAMRRIGDPGPLTCTLDRDDEIQRLHIQGFLLPPEDKQGYGALGALGLLAGVIALGAWRVVRRQTSPRA